MALSQLVSAADQHAHAPPHIGRTGHYKRHSVRWRGSPNSRQTVVMDWRVKNFESEARAAFAFLCDEGFLVATDSAADLNRRPASITVRFAGSDTTVETSLVLGFAGEDAIQTSVRTPTVSSDFGPTVAHKGHEMRKALRAHADGVRGVATVS